MTNEVLAKRIADLERQLSDERTESMRLETENKRLDANLTSKTEIANQLKDGLADAFERESKLKGMLEVFRAALEIGIRNGLSCAELKKAIQIAGAKETTNVKD